MKQLREGWSWPTITAPLVFGLALVLVVTSCSQADNPVAPSAAPNQLTANVDGEPTPTPTPTPTPETPTPTPTPNADADSGDADAHSNAHSNADPNADPNADSNADADADARPTGLHTWLLEAGPSLRFMACAVRARSAVRPLL